MKHKWKIIDEQKQKLNELHNNMNAVAESTELLKKSALKILELCSMLDGKGSYGTDK